MLLLMDLDILSLGRNPFFMLPRFEFLLHPIAVYLTPKSQELQEILFPLLLHVKILMIIFLKAFFGSFSLYIAFGI